jgi:hypothetical protein
MHRAAEPSKESPFRLVILVGAKCYVPPGVKNRDGITSKGSLVDELLENGAMVVRVKHLATRPVALHTIFQ